VCVCVCVCVCVEGGSVHIKRFHDCPEKQTLILRGCCSVTFTIRLD